MNFFAILMTVLIFASGFDLCAEIKSCDSENKTELSSSSDTHQQKSEMCTPFCHCSRCAFSIILPEKIKASSINAFSVDSFNSSQTVILTQISSSIWQPPKFA